VRIMNRVLWCFTDPMVRGSEGGIGLRAAGERGDIYVC
jgi:hypothetical protein